LSLVHQDVPRLRQLFESAKRGAELFLRVLLHQLRHPRAEVASRGLVFEDESYTASAAPAATDITRSVSPTFL
jgi:hypothetical protein